MKNKKKECDILVIGAGVSGICAAVSAARHGAKVLIVEKKNIPGGAVTAGMHRFICGLYLSGAGIPKGTLNSGIGGEIERRLTALDPSEGIKRMGRVYVLPFRTNNLIKVLTSLLTSEPKIDLMYGTRVKGAETNNSLISSVYASDGNGNYTILPSGVIDCSGSSVVSDLIGIKHLGTRDCLRQLSGYTFKINGLEEDKELNLKVPYFLTKAVQGESIPMHLKFTAFWKGKEKGEGFIKINTPYGENDLEKAEEEAATVFTILYDKIQAFHGSSVDKNAPSELIERDAKRTHGNYILTEDDILSSRHFRDGIVKSSWPLEFWHRNRGPVYKYLDNGLYYEIPERCLKSGFVSNLYSSGKCISVSEMALASVRVSGTCISLGEASGTLAVKDLKNKGV